MSRKAEHQEPWKPGGEPDEHHGAGGTYIVKDGKRVLVDGSRTEPPKGDTVAEGTPRGDKIDVYL